MKRDLDQLARKTYDLLIVGGGIYGAALAREAALYGLAVALVEQGDFCAATSANSLKIMHGGIRYLQQFDLPRLRQSVTERRILMRLAPHLVHPLPCAMPTEGGLLKSRPALFCGLLAYNCLGWDRNKDLAASQIMPRGRLGSRAEWLRIAPALDDPRYTGVALWHDACAYNSERLGLGFIQAAVRSGAQAANYVEVTGFSTGGGLPACARAGLVSARELGQGSAQGGQRRGCNVTGVSAVDRLTGRSLALSAKLTVINTGPWTNRTLALLQDNLNGPKIRLALAMNLVLRRQLVPRYAIGLTAQKAEWQRSRLFFFVPWRERTIVGTYLRPHAGDAASPNVSEDNVREFIQSINQAYPGARLQLEDVAFIHAGLLPAEDEDVVPGAEPRLLNHFQIIDHAQSDGIEGLLTVLGVKYTTARDVAQRTMKRVAAKLGRKLPEVRADEQPLPGGASADLEQLVGKAIKAGLSAAAARRMAYNYGADFSAVVQLASAEKQMLAPLSATANASAAEVVHAVRHEMAMTLADVVLRRTELGSAGPPDDAALQHAASLMARELGWDDVRKQKEIEELKTLPNWRLT